MDCHDFLQKSRNDKKEVDCHDSTTAESRNDNAFPPSLRADEIGAAIHKQKELESKIDSLVYTLYNLTNDEITTIDSKT